MAESTESTVDDKSTADDKSTPTPVEEEASRKGWTPLKKWVDDGNPAKDHMDAATFVYRGEMIKQIGNRFADVINIWHSFAFMFRQLLIPVSTLFDCDANYFDFIYGQTLKAKQCSDYGFNFLPMFRDQFIGTLPQLRFD